MAKYTVTSFDNSVSGMERLRNQSEFILLAYPWEDSVPVDIRRQWVDDIQSCDRFDGFDYEAAREAVNEWYNESGEDIVAHAIAYLNSQVESWDDVEFSDESPVFRLYVETSQD